MIKTWHQLYEEEIRKKGSIKKYVEDKIVNKKKLINLIIKYSPNKTIIEPGCGTATISTHFASLGYISCAVDIDLNILNLAKKISKEYEVNSPPSFKRMSILKLKFRDLKFDVAFSNGVLEHFNDDDIIKILKEEMRIAKTVIVGIPTKYFDQSEAMYGDERYLDIKSWRSLIAKSGGDIIEESSYHFLDFKKRVFDFKKWFRPNPFKIFVIQKQINSLV